MSQTNLHSAPITLRYVSYGKFLSKKLPSGPLYNPTSSGVSGSKTCPRLWKPLFQTPPLSPGIEHAPTNECFACLAGAHRCTHRFADYNGRVLHED